MKVYVNNQEIQLLPGMTVKHALVHCKLLQEIESGKRVYDEWGNEVGLSGALWDGARIYVR
ncbi:MAG: hypothetical protein C0392_09620 [Syntrophus sp. (in: bacteria)]|nr:hypothetical protein [Syntrophus sp. (in: bacteria)]